MIKEAYIICKIFENEPTANIMKWEQIFSLSETTFYEYGFVCTHEVDGIVYVNSATINDTPFTVRMLKHIHRAVRNKHDAVIASSIPNIRTLINNGFIYDELRQQYIRGTKYYKQLEASRRGERG